MQLLGVDFAHACPTRPGTPDGGGAASARDRPRRAIAPTARHRARLRLRHRAHRRGRRQHADWRSAQPLTTIAAADDDAASPPSRS
ncbi:MAG: hypothetical protein MZW92_63920 [Comamonadaceae bacterium]|nr:hypothetical protein [Comamonadaceae bacterium]